jgi:hypothetical protein
MLASRRVEVADGYVLYPRGYGSGATVLRHATPTGSEDFVSFEERPAQAAVTYKVVFRKGVSGLRLVANTLEMLDVKGAPRLRVAPPFIIGADGACTDANLGVEGCSVETNPAPPWGRPVTPPGAETCTVRVAWNDEAVLYPALLDPKWTNTGLMSAARQGHTSTMLSTGKVLVAGGTSNGTTALATAELYDPPTNTWAATAAMNGARWNHTALQLGTTTNANTSGKVLIAGGYNGSNSIATSRLYSPTAGTWLNGGSMGTPRAEHTATILNNGRVLAVGGVNGSTVFESATIYNPNAGTAGTWNSTLNLPSNAKLRWHTATRLTTSNATLNDRVLVVGGNSGGTTSVATVFLFDSSNSSWTALTALPDGAREGHTATAMSDGKVLVTGGRSGASTILDTALLFDPASGSGSWAAAGGALRSVFMRQCLQLENLQ